MADGLRDYIVVTCPIACEEAACHNWESVAEKDTSLMATRKQWGRQEGVHPKNLAFFHFLNVPPAPSMTKPSAHMHLEEFKILSTTVLCLVNDKFL